MTNHTGLRNHPWGQVAFSHVRPGKWGHRRAAPGPVNRPDPTNSTGRGPGVPTPTGSLRCGAGSTDPPRPQAQELVPTPASTELQPQFPGAPGVATMRYAWNHGQGRVARCNDRSQAMETPLAEAAEVGRIIFRTPKGWENGASCGAAPPQIGTGHGAPFQPPAGPPPPRCEGGLLARGTAGPHGDRVAPATDARVRSNARRRPRRRMARHTDKRRGAAVPRRLESARSAHAAALHMTRMPRPRFPAAGAGRT